MAKEPVIIGLDIGSQTIKILGVLRDNNSDLFRVRFFEEIPVFGFSRGRIKDDKLLTKRIIELFNKVEEKYDTQIQSVITNISGSRLELLNNKASVSVSGANGRVSELDKERVFEDVKTIVLGNNKKVLKVFPKEWCLDGEKDISDPFGLQGIRLELEASILTCFSSDRELLEMVINNSGVAIEDIIPTPFADATALLDDTQKELGAMVINIGFGTTSMIVYEDGKIVDLAVFPVGSSHITNDIAIGLQTEINIAEKIKLDYGLPESSNKKIEINLKTFLGGLDIEEEEEEQIKKSKKQKNNKDYLTFTEKNLKDIIAPRLTEIFGLIKERLKKSGKYEKLPAGIVLTGGGSKLKGLEDFAKKEFKLPCKIGCSAKFIGLEKKDPSYTTVCGLVLIDNEFEEDRVPSKNNIIEKIKGFFSNFTP
ncbi:MAG TPA: cell division protein FtsA [Candidatus Pacearchaeota archaeon]|nr:cell division protein FtsA [Candidatus Pacearchaeota archaeon]